MSINKIGGVSRQPLSYQLVIHLKNLPVANITEKLKTMGKTNTIIGIDPDVEKSGVAILTIEPYSLNLKSMTFSELVDFAYASVEHKDDMSVVVEGGWINHSHFHLSAKTRGYLAARMGNDVGRNHETGRKIIEVFEHLGYAVDIQKPLRKIWKGKDGKITKQELEAFAGPVGLCNQDCRDAALLAWDKAGLAFVINKSDKSC